MPWVKTEDCTGCGICVEECPVDAIRMLNELAEITMEQCIRCGKCHEACPEDAVRHDSELIPDEIRKNVEKAKSAMDACALYFGDGQEKKNCLTRWLKYFTMQRRVIEKTIEELESLQSSPGKNAEKS